VRPVEGRVDLGTAEHARMAQQMLTLAGKRRRGLQGDRPACRADAHASPWAARIREGARGELVAVACERVACDAADASSASSRGEGPGSSSRRAGNRSDEGGQEHPTPIPRQTSRLMPAASIESTTTAPVAGNAHCIAGGETRPRSPFRRSPRAPPGPGRRRFAFLRFLFSCQGEADAVVAAAASAFVQRFRRSDREAPSSDSVRFARRRTILSSMSRSPSRLPRYPSNSRSRAPSSSPCRVSTSAPSPLMRTTFS
jgi:hypothetical protein